VADDKITIGYAVYNFTNPYYFGIMDGGNFAADELGCEVIWKSCEGSIEEEISIIENFIEQDVDVICMDPVDAKALVDVINKATNAGIPVVTFNNIIEGVDAYAYTPNSPASGQYIAELMCHYIGKKGAVGILQEQPGNNSSDVIEQGFRDAIAKYPDIEIVAAQVTNFDPDKALQITQTWLSTLEELDAIICISNSSAAAAAQAIKAAGKTGEIATFSVDGMNNELIASGEQIGDSGSYTLAVGYWNIKVCYDITKDPSSWPKLIQYTPDCVATAESIEIMKNNGLLEDAPGIILKDVSEYIRLNEAGDPTKIPINWDEGCGPLK
jgi:ribose transport system substrate-binding protein